MTHEWHHVIISWISNDDIINLKNGCHIWIPWAKITLCAFFLNFLIMFDTWMTACHHAIISWIINDDTVKNIKLLHKSIPCMTNDIPAENKVYSMKQTQNIIWVPIILYLKNLQIFVYFLFRSASTLSQVLSIKKVKFVIYLWYCIQVWVTT